MLLTWVTKDKGEGSDCHLDSAWPETARPCKLVFLSNILSLSGKYPTSSCRKQIFSLLLLAFALKDLLNILPMIDCFLLKTSQETEERSCVGLNIYFCSCFYIKKQLFKKKLRIITRGTVSNLELRLRNECQLI